MTESDRRGQDNASALRERLTRLSEASLHINESLDLDAVLQGYWTARGRSLTQGTRSLLHWTMQAGSRTFWSQD